MPIKIEPRKIEDFPVKVDSNDKQQMIELVRKYVNQVTNDTIYITDLMIQIENADNKRIKVIIIE